MCRVSLLSPPLTRPQELGCWLHGEGNAEDQQKALWATWPSAPATPAIAHTRKAEGFSNPIHGASAHQLPSEERSCRGACCRPGAPRRWEGTVRTTSSWPLASWAYTGFNKCLRRHFWSLTPVFNQKLGNPNASTSSEQLTCFNILMPVVR